MQTSAMKACFQIAECSLSNAKIRTFSQRAYTWFSEDITIIGDLFHFAIFHLYGALCITSNAHPLSIALDSFLIFIQLI